MPAADNDVRPPAEVSQECASLMVCLANAMQTWHHVTDGGYSWILSRETAGDPQEWQPLLFETLLDALIKGFAEADAQCFQPVYLHLTHGFADAFEALADSYDGPADARAAVQRAKGLTMLRSAVLDPVGVRERWVLS